MRLRSSGQSGQRFFFVFDVDAAAATSAVALAATEGRLINAGLDFWGLDVLVAAAAAASLMRLRSSGKGLFLDNDDDEAVPAGSKGVGRIFGGRPIFLGSFSSGKGLVFDGDDDDDEAVPAGSEGVGRIFGGRPNFLGSFTAASSFFCSAAAASRMR